MGPQPTERQKHRQRGPRIKVCSKRYRTSVCMKGNNGLSVGDSCEARQQMMQIRRALFSERVYAYRVTMVCLWGTHVKLDSKLCKYAELYFLHVSCDLTPL